MMMYFVADLMYFVLFNGGWMDRPFYEYVVAWLWQEIVVLPSYAHFLWTDDGLFRWNGRVLKVTSDAWMEREVVMNR
jgi:hypothetical protein